MGERSRHALLFTISRMAKEGDLYMWTFTLRHREPIDAAIEYWRRMCTDILIRGLGMRGVRVFELHPRGHGLHVHVVTPCYIHVSEVRARLVGTPWGRVHVRKVDSGELGAEYVGKYLRKSKRHPGLKGKRLWQTFGGFEGCRVLDVEGDSTLAKRMKGVQLLLGLEGSKGRFTAFRLVLVDRVLDLVEAAHE